MQEPRPRVGRRDLPGERRARGGRQRLREGLNAAGGKPRGGGAGQKGLTPSETVLQHA